MSTLLLTAALIAASFGDGQGPADPNARLDGFALGQVVDGTNLELDQLRGKVVLVVMGGS